MKLMPSCGIQGTVDARTNGQLTAEREAGRLTIAR